MRSNLRFILPLIASVALVSYLFAFYRAESVKRTLRSDLTRHAETLAESLQETIEPLVHGTADRNLQRVVEKFDHKDNLAGLAVYDASGNLLAISSGLSTTMRTPPDPATQAAQLGHGVGQFMRVDGVPSEIYAVPLYREGQMTGTLALLYNASSINAQTAATWHDVVMNAGIETILIVVLTMLLIRWTFRDPLARTAVWLRALRLGHRSSAPPPADGEMFEQITTEAAHLARNLVEARTAAEVEAHLRETSQALWTAERLRVSLRGKLQNSPLFVVSNREPYMHVRREKSIEVVVPASGVVTALEPVMVSCDGTWIAQGSGDADREMVDEHDHLRVPPESPSYTLRRVWLTPEEEKGFYFGFANEGIWPLCHTAYTRPVFRSNDWKYYQRVNWKFADAVLQEMEHTASPVVLVQDYHFALLPRLIKEARPDARVAIFWHIPWPNPEVFGICPWQRELLDGLLGADLIGLHTQFHCNNFIETVNRSLEARTEWDRFAVNRQGHLTWIRPFPISVAFPESPAAEDNSPLPPTEREVARDNARDRARERDALLAPYGVEARYLGVGVDRADYTKGIIERFRGIEKFLETYPAFQRQFTFVQVAAPSRSEIPAYSGLQRDLVAEANRINAKFQTARWKPIVILERHHTHAEIERLFRAADLCMVTSLHDGMNLVAKEFVVSRDDLRGALILSHFTGASRELVDALLVNPYDTQQLAERIREALEMPPEEQSERMEHMRRVVREHNIYRWAGGLLTELCDIRVDHPERTVRVERAEDVEAA